MNRGIWLSGLLTVAWCAIGANLRAADTIVNLRLGTLAPNGTSYYRSLQAMGEKWRDASGGVVKLTILPGGSQGSEADMVGLMQTGNLDAGLLTAVGLSEIEPGVNALQSMPMSFRNLDEVDYVGEKLRPMLEKRLLDKGYVVLFWTDSGWVRFFTKRLVLHPEDLRKHKIFSWAGNAHEYDLWKSTGFHPVSLETKGIAGGLFNGTIDAVPMPPFFALSGQLDSQTKHMLELNWAPLVGAAVVRKKSWDRVANNTHEALLKIAAEIGQQVKAEGRAESESSVTAMAKRGLIVQKVSPEVEAEWREVVEKVQNEIRGRIVPADMFDEAQKLLREFRAAGGGKPK